MRAAVALLLACAYAAQAADRFGVESVRFEHLVVDDGLSQTTVRTIGQDAAGFIWIGTQDGLNRYDGYEVRVFRREADDPHSLPDSHVLAIAPAAGGGIWVGTQNGGLARFDPIEERFERIAPGDKAAGQLAANPVSALLAHSDGALWVASGNGEVQRAASATGTPQFVDVAGPQSRAIGSIRRLREGVGGMVWIAASGGVWRASAEGAPPRRIDLDGRVIDAHDAIEAPDRTLWIATDRDGLLHLDANGALLRRYGVEDGVASDAQRALLIDRAQRLWVATMGGLSRIDPGAADVLTWGREAQLPEDGLSATRLQSLFEDRDGVLWVGTWVNGLSVFDPRSAAFATLRPQPGNPLSLPGYAVTDIALDPKAGVWLAINDAGVAHYEFGAGLRERIGYAAGDPAGVPGQVRALAFDAEQGLWVAAGTAAIGHRPAGQARFILHRHDPGDAASAPPGETYDLKFTRDGTLWIGSIGGGLASRCAGCDGFVRWPHDPQDPHGLAGTDVNTVLETSDGSLWIAFRHSGLSRLDRASGRLERLPVQPDDPAALSYPSISCLTEDADGVLWVGTQGGGINRLRRGDDGIWRVDPRGRISRANGLGADAIGGILFDRDGRAWVSTTVGLSRIDRSGAIVNFGKHEGALGSGYFIGSSLALPDGRMLFGGPRGLTLFDPDEVRPPPAPASVVVSEVRVFGSRGGDGMRFRRHGDDGGLRLSLPAEADDFHIDLSALSYTAPNQLIYEYRLEPLDSDWIVTDARRRFAAYTNVPAGDYMFRARARRPGGEPSAELGVPVHVDAPPDQAAPLRWLSFGLASLMVLAIVWMLRGRLRDRRHAQERLRNSEERLKLALWGTGDELWDLDLQTNVLRRENPLLHLRTAPGNTIDAMQLRGFAHPDDIPPFDDALRRHLRGETAFLDVSFRAQDLADQWRWLRVRGRVAARDAQGRALRLAGTTADITVLKQHEAALERVNRELEERVVERTHALSDTNAELADTLAVLTRTQHELVEREKMAALGGLVAGVAHEINTPLGIGVTAASHLDAASREFRDHLKAGRVTRSELDRYTNLAFESAELILRNLQRADKLVKSFKQVAADQSSEERRRIELSSYLDEVLTSLKPALRRANHRIELEAEPGLVIDTYPGAIYQVTANLVQNSLMHGFAERHGGTIAIKVAREHDAVVVHYRDDGVGMEDDVRRRVFDPFFTTRRGSGGSGLGMHIAYNLVTQVLRGTIHCASTKGQGVHFTISLPTTVAGT